MSAPPDVDPGSPTPILDRLAPLPALETPAAERGPALLDEIERAIASLPDETQRVIIQRSLDRWRSELAGTAGAPLRT